MTEKSKGIGQRPGAKAKPPTEPKARPSTATALAAIRLATIDGDKIPLEKATQDIPKGSRKGLSHPDALTPKQERFCQLIQQGCTYAEAYRQSYDLQSTRPNAAYEAASRLVAKAHIKARLAELRDNQSYRSQHDAGQVRDEVLTALRNILSNSTSTDRDRMKAAELLGKWGEVALFSEVSSQRDEPASADAALEALKAKLAKLVS